MSTRPNRRAGEFLLVVGGTVVALAGTDLVLPAVPGLSGRLGGNLALAQLVLAGFTAGSASGLILFGELGARFDQRTLLVGSLGGYAVASWLCTLSTSLDVLIGLRFAQGVASAAAAVFAPGFLRRLYGDAGSIRALGVLGSIEALVPALAPLIGVWLLGLGGWRTSFHVLGVLSLMLGVVIAARRKYLPEPTVTRDRSGYVRLLKSRVFLRYALTQAFTVGALLVFVFGAPTVMTVVLGGSLNDFIVMQVSGIACFVACANMTGYFVHRFGAERMIWWGTVTTAVGSLVMWAYAMGGGHSPRVVTLIFIVVNTGLALRGPPGFHRAIIAARDDARGAALTVMAILLTVSAGTAVVAPFITYGLVALATGAVLLACASVVLLRILPELAPPEAAAISVP